MTKISLGGGLFTIIDDSDFDKVSKYTWYIGRGNYATTTTINVSGISLHRFIIKPPSDMVVDHIDGDRLDNRKSNLRVCTHSENLKNRIKHDRSGTSKYKGVTYNRECGKWISRIRVDNVKYGLGSYHNEIDATVSYNIGSVLLSPEFGSLNYIPSIDNERILSNYTCRKLIKLSQLPEDITTRIIDMYRKKGH